MMESLMARLAQVLGQAVSSAAFQQFADAMLRSLLDHLIAMFEHILQGRRGPQAA